VNVPNEELDRWAREVRQVRAWLTNISDRLPATAPEEMLQMALQARTKAHDMLRAMIRAGAEDPMEADRRERLGESYQPAAAPVPIELLSSPAAREYAAAIRAAAVACRKMEAERGIGDGYAEHLEDVARAAEFEVYGPAGLGEQ